MKNYKGNPYPLPTNEEMERMDIESHELYLHDLYVGHLLYKLEKGIVLEGDEVFDAIKFAKDIEHSRTMRARIKNIDRSNR